jgi:ABC-type histidine transport system ATPase subunit
MKVGVYVRLKAKPGDSVRVIGSRGTAKIRAILTSMHGALLEKQIDGFRRWNLNEIRLVKQGRSKAK